MHLLLQENLQETKKCNMFFLSEHFFKWIAFKIITWHDDNIYFYYRSISLEILSNNELNIVTRYRKFTYQRHYPYQRLLT